MTLRENCSSRRTLLFAPILLIISGLAQATTVVIPSDDELVAGARAIVRGRVVSMTTRFDVNRGMVFTYVALRVDEVLKGAITSRQIVLKQPGGMADGYGSLFHGAPEFNLSERVFLYLDTWADGSLRVHEWYLGKFSVMESRRGRSEVSRETPGGNVSILGRSQGGVITEQMEIDDYEQMVRSLIAANSPSSSSDERELDETPILAFPPEYIPVAQDDLEPVANFNLLNPHCPLRWFEADTGQPVRFNINSEPGPSGQLPARVSPDELFEDVLKSMSAFSSLPGSSIRFTVGAGNLEGIRAGDGNSISFNNGSFFSAPQGHGAGKCYGALAVGGVTLYDLSNPSIVNGTTFYRIVDADVAFNPYLNCWYKNNRCRLQEVMTHELGHAIGLGHSADWQATMSPVVHDDRRCASLRDDDKNGVRFLYPTVP